MNKRHKLKQYLFVRIQDSSFCTKGTAASLFLMSLKVIFASFALYHIIWKCRCKQHVIPFQAGGNGTPPPCSSEAISLHQAAVTLTCHLSSQLLGIVGRVLWQLQRCRAFRAGGPPRFLQRSRCSPASGHQREFTVKRSSLMSEPRGEARWY